MRNLSSREANLRNFFRSLGATAGEVAPVAEQQAVAVRQPRHHVQRAGRRGPAVHPGGDQRGPGDAGRGDPRVPVPAACSWPTTRRSSASCGPACAALRRAAPALARALKIGTPTLIRSQILNLRLIPLFLSLERFANDPQVPLGVRDLTALANSLNPTLAYLTPAQTVCNYVVAVVPQRVAPAVARATRTAPGSASS